MTPRLSSLDFRDVPDELLERIMAEGVRRALRAHKAAGVPAIVWDREAGQIVEVPPEQIPDFPDEPLEEGEGGR